MPQGVLYYSHPKQPTMSKQYRVLLEYWVPDENENCWEEQIVISSSSAGRIADQFLAKDRTNQLRSVDVIPV